MKRIFKTDKELIAFANENEIKYYRAKNVLTKEYPLFGVWEMEWEYLGSNASYEVKTK